MFKFIVFLSSFLYSVGPDVHLAATQTYMTKSHFQVVLLENVEVQTTVQNSNQMTFTKKTHSLLPGHLKAVGRYP